MIVNTLLCVMVFKLLKIKLHTFLPIPLPEVTLSLYGCPFHPQLYTATSPECFSQLCCHNQAPEIGYLRNRTLLLEVKAEIQGASTVGLWEDPLPGLQVASFSGHVRAEELPSVLYRASNMTSFKTVTSQTSLLLALRASSRDTVFSICIITDLGIFCLPICFCTNQPSFMSIASNFFHL